MIHRGNCRYARIGLPWLWAENQTEETVAWVITELRYKTCLVCNPIDRQLLGRCRIINYVTA